MVYLLESSRYHTCVPTHMFGPHNCPQVNITICYDDLFSIVMYTVYVPDAATQLKKCLD